MTVSSLLHPASEHAEPIAELGDVITEHVLFDWAWLLIAAPFVAMFLITFFGKRLPREGAEIAVAAMGFVFAYSAVLLVMNISSGVMFEKSVEIAEVGPVVLAWGWVIDGLSTMMFFIVGSVGLLVFIYAMGYMKGDVRVTNFFASFSLFAGAMLLLVGAENLIQLIVGWELVGVASYLLIGHYWEDKANSSAGMKAFYVNKVADVGLVIGVIVLGVTVGSFNINTILDQAAAHSETLGTVAVVAAILLFFGAMGKSAQFPLHVWLPDAMAGPTPVSALMHAATMVTAGVYLIARMFPLYEGLASDVRVLVMAIGAITIIIAGLLALVQDDIKRVLAYSTVSQLGYMVAALGAGGYTAGLFHLWTHAFFKALLFLGAGAAIHSVHSNNMSDMGGLRRAMPRTFVTFVIGSLALAALPPLAGFFSKDEILATFNAEGYQFLLWIGVIGAFVTALYMAKTVFLTFYGSYKGHGQPHEAPALMTVPLMILAGLSIVGGWVNIPGLYTGFNTWVTTRAQPIIQHHLEGFDLFALALGLVFVVAGIGVAYFLYFGDADTQIERDRLRIPVLWPLLEKKYYLDDAYWYGIVSPIRGPIARTTNWVNDYIIDWVVNAAGVATAAVGRVVYRGFDQRGIDLVVNSISATTDAAGGRLRFLQTGRVQQYAGAVVVGAVVLTVAFVIFN